ncbi:hypothetical protein NEMBOFW57_005579 [Staphylotrichum longicolle]|uniref:Uncharacterized protein n=1 Tax=Staphylotrichum longicolle TaxID=669026 RepID=A0AAD4I0E9_9PEZI|nr:hypothetical protein NEMBOFW57_005579 [Staphylotrichum longicolle]
MSSTTTTITGPDAHVHRLANLAFGTIPSGNWVVAHLAPTSDDGKLAPPPPPLTPRPPPSPPSALNLPRPSGTQPQSTSPTSPSLPEVPSQPAPAPANPRPPHRHAHPYPPASLLPPTNPNDSVVVLVAEWLPGHHLAIEQASRAHQLITARDPGLGARFLGHVTEWRAGGRGPFAFVEDEEGRKEEVESLELGKSPSVFEERAERVGRLADPEGGEAGGV